MLRTYGQLLSINLTDEGISAIGHGCGELLSIKQGGGRCGDEHGGC
jgi:hypothetical protein